MPTLRQFFVILVVAGSLAAVYLTPERHAAAVDPKNEYIRPYSTSMVSPPNNQWNPDGGSNGLVKCGGGGTMAGRWGAVNVETESTTPVYFAWGSPNLDGGGKPQLTQSNYNTIGKKRCVGCNNGSSYQAQIGEGNVSLYAISSGSSDAGVTLSVECAR